MKKTYKINTEKLIGHLKDDVFIYSCTYESSNTNTGRTLVTLSLKDKIITLVRTLGYFETDHFDIGTKGIQRLEKVLNLELETNTDFIFNTTGIIEEITKEV